MFVAHQKKGPFSLGVIYDCPLAVGNPRRTLHSPYDSRCMPVMFGEPIACRGYIPDQSTKSTGKVLKVRHRHKTCGRG